MKNILLASSDSDTSQNLTKILSSGKYTVKKVASGDELLYELEAKPYDLILSEVTLPGLNGVELLEKAGMRNPRIEVILISSYPLISKPERVLSLGAFAVASKTTKPKELLKIVKDALRSDKLIRVAQSQYGLYDELEKTVRLLGIGVDKQVLFEISKEGIRISGAEEFSEIQERLLLEHVDLVLTHFEESKPEIFELSKKIRSLDKNVMIASYGKKPSDGSALKTLNENCDLFLEEPFDIKSFTDKLTHSDLFDRKERRKEFGNNLVDSIIQNRNITERLLTSRSSRLRLRKEVTLALSLLLIFGGGILAAITLTMFAMDLYVQYVKEPAIEETYLEPIGEELPEEVEGVPEEELPWYLARVEKEEIIYTGEELAKPTAEDKHVGKFDILFENQEEKRRAQQFVRKVLKDKEDRRTAKQLLDRALQR